MKEIKFRGLRIDNNEWVYGDLTNEPTGVFIRWIYKPSQNEFSWRNFKDMVIPESVGQLLNVLDGIEIYSNQLLKASWEITSKGRYFQSSDAYIEHNLIGMFEWKNFGYMFKTIEGKFITIPSCAKFEIIKNIHQNK